MLKYKGLLIVVCVLFCAWNSYAYTPRHTNWAQNVGGITSTVTGTAFYNQPQTMHVECGYRTNSHGFTAISEQNWEDFTYSEDNPCRSSAQVLRGTRPNPGSGDPIGGINTPVGEPVIALLLCIAAYVIIKRKKKCA